MICLVNCRNRSKGFVADMFSVFMALGLMRSPGLLLIGNRDRESHSRNRSKTDARAFLTASRYYLNIQPNFAALFGLFCSGDGQIELDHEYKLSPSINNCICRNHGLAFEFIHGTYGTVYVFCLFYSGKNLT